MIVPPSPYRSGLDKNAANYITLTPVTFLDRAASVWPDRTAVVHGAVRRNWVETARRSRKLASALRARGITPGHTVAFLATNTPELLEAHFGVPMMGGVLNAINTRLDAKSISFILDHGEARILFVDREFSATARQALALLSRRIPVIDIDDPVYEGAGALIGEKNYEAFLDEGDETETFTGPADEWDPIALNYTSGTTGNPKGVVYHHRGAYLNAVSNVMSWGLSGTPVYLWTLPMFHCNGWCFPWSIAAVGGTNVCLRSVRVDAVIDLMQDEGVTHFCGAPIVLNMINNVPAEVRDAIPQKIHAMVAGAPPPASVIAGMERMGWDVTHVYGLTESYGPSVINIWQSRWNDLDLNARSAIKARQGVRGPMLEELMVADPETLQPVARDGETIGEIFMRGNNVFAGYLKNPTATAESFDGDWFHTGDLAVWHEDGYVEIKDRSKDIIISGGENISSIEIEDVLYRHPDVMEAAVVARPDDKWGETPCAFVVLKEGRSVTEEELLTFCRTQLAGFKTPKTIVFGPLPRTQTGKVQKFVLRETAREL